MSIRMPFVLLLMLVPSAAGAQQSLSLSFSFDDAGTDRVGVPDETRGIQIEIK